MLQFDLLRTMFLEHLPDEARIAWIVFNQEHDVNLSLDHMLRLGCGNLAMVSQKSLMLLTTPSNSSNCTGLLK
jgi:hypothetical protein